MNAIGEHRNQLAIHPSACASTNEAVCQMIGVSQNWIKAALTPATCYLNWEIEKSLLYHSSPLVDCSVPVRIQSQANLSLLGSQEREVLDHDAKVNINQTSTSGILEEYSKYNRTPAEMRVPSSIPECIRAKSDPLVEWLAAQSFESVKHYDLLKKAIEIYGDPLEAIGIICSLFDMERQQCPSRGRACILGNKMQPLHPIGSTKYKNPVGENYHFWAQITASMTESTAYENIANFGLEWIKDGDDGEYNANKMAIEIGKAAIHKARDRASAIGTAAPVSNCKL